MRQAMHVALLAHMSNANTILTRKCERKRLLGKPRYGERKVQGCGCIYVLRMGSSGDLCEHDMVP
jgi:hypothetical protein